MHTVFEIDIQAEPQAVFDRLANVNAFTEWLPPSREYIRTELNGDEIKAGARYTDYTTSGRMTGTVRVYEPPRVIEFYQEMVVLGIHASVAMHYEVVPRGAGAHVRKGYTFTLPLLMRPVEWALRGRLFRESQRVMEALKTACEGSGGAA